METRSTFTFVTCHHASLMASTRTHTHTRTHLYHIRPFLLSSHCFLDTPNLPSICRSIGVSNLFVGPHRLRATERDKHSCIVNVWFRHTHTRVTRMEWTHADISSAYYAWIRFSFIRMRLVYECTLYQPCSKRMEISMQNEFHGKCRSGNRLQSSSSSAILVGAENSENKNK